MHSQEDTPRPEHAFNCIWYGNNLNNFKTKHLILEFDLFVIRKQSTNCQMRMRCIARYTFEIRNSEYDVEDFWILNIECFDQTNDYLWFGHSKNHIFTISEWWLNVNKHRTMKTPIIFFGASGLESWNIPDSMHTNQIHIRK